MNERVLIIVGIIAQYFMNEHDFSSEREIVEELLSAGFKEEEISEAFTWMEKVTLHPDRPHHQPTLKPPCLRLFSPEEQLALSVEAQGFLIKLRTSGILCPEVEEEIIFKACHNDGEENSLNDIKSITVLALFASMQYEGSREIDCIIEDNWQKLYH